MKFFDKVGFLNRTYKSWKESAYMETGMSSDSLLDVPRGLRWAAARSGGARSFGASASGFQVTYGRENGTGAFLLCSLFE